VFDSSISADSFSEIYSLGPAYFCNFNPEKRFATANQSSSAVTQATLLQRKASFGTLVGGLMAPAKRGADVDSIARKILLNLHPLIQDRSSTDLAYLSNSINPKLMDLRIVPDSRIYHVATMSVKDALHCMAGIEALLPIFPQLDVVRQLDPEGFRNADPNFHSVRGCALLCQTLSDFLNASFTHQRKFELLGGFALLSWVLQRVNPENLSSKTLFALFGISQITLTPGLSDQLLRHILFCARLWVRSDDAVLQELLSITQTLSREDPDRIRGTVTLQYLIDQARDCAPAPSPASSSVTVPATTTTTVTGIPDSADDRAANKTTEWFRGLLWVNAKQQLQQITTKTVPLADAPEVKLEGEEARREQWTRQLLMSTVRMFIVHGNGLLNTSIDILLHHCHETPLDRQVLDILNLFLEFACMNPPPNWVGYLYGLGLEPLVVLAHRRDPEIKVTVLRLCCRLYALNAQPNTSRKRVRPERMDDALMYLSSVLAGYVVDQSVFDFLLHHCLCVDSSIEDLLEKEFCQGVEPLLRLMFELLSYATFTTRIAVVTNLLPIMVHNSKNRDMMTSSSEWREWLFMCLKQPQINQDFDPEVGATPENVKTLQDLVIDILRLVIESRFDQKNGWTCLSDVLTFIRISGSYGIVDTQQFTTSLLCRIFIALQLKFKVNLIKVAPTEPFWDNIVRVAVLVEEFVIGRKYEEPDSDMLNMLEQMEGKNSKVMAGDVELASPSVEMTTPSTLTHQPTDDFVEVVVEGNEAHANDEDELEDDDVIQLENAPRLPTTIERGVAECLPRADHDIAVISGFFELLDPLLVKSTLQRSCLDLLQTTCLGRDTFMLILVRLLIFTVGYEANLELVVTNITRMRELLLSSDRFTAPNDPMPAKKALPLSSKEAKAIEQAEAVVLLYVSDFLFSIVMEPFSVREHSGSVFRQQLLNSRRVSNSNLPTLVQADEDVERLAGIIESPTETEDEFANEIASKNQSAEGSSTLQDNALVDATPATVVEPELNIPSSSINTAAAHREAARARSKLSRLSRSQPPPPEPIIDWKATWPTALPVLDTFHTAVASMLREILRRKRTLLAPWFVCPITGYKPLLQETGSLGSVAPLDEFIKDMSSPEWHSIWNSSHLQDGVRKGAMEEEIVLRAMVKERTSQLRKYFQHLLSSRKQELKRVQAANALCFDCNQKFVTTERLRREQYVLNEDIQKQTMSKTWRGINKRMTSDRGPWYNAQDKSVWKLENAENSMRMRMKLARDHDVHKWHHQLQRNEKGAVIPKSSSRSLDGESYPLDLASIADTFGDVSAGGEAAATNASPGVPQRSSQQGSIEGSESPALPIASVRSSSIVPDSDEAEQINHMIAQTNSLRKMSVVRIDQPNLRSNALVDDDKPGDKDGEGVDTQDWGGEEEGGSLMTQHTPMGVTFSCQWIRQNHLVWGFLTIDSTHTYLIFRPDMDHPKNQALPEYVGGYFQTDPLKTVVKYKKWDLKALEHVHRRQYLLRRSALELFFSNHTTAFFNFPHGVSRKVWRHLSTTSQLQTILRFDSYSPPKALAKSGLTQKWVDGEISNFEYLMALNTHAGRTLADLTQYPVFPWVLCDYTSDILDLNNPAVYRDLTKPVGALNPDRLTKFKERLESFEDQGIPPFLYGTHYSNIGTVLFYLIRLEPFSSMQLQLQSGHFDAPDRSFFSIERAWFNCLYSSTDVKELIPEFFFLPEMFVNSNNIDIGRLQDSHEYVDHVALPPWARNSPERFVQLHRQALESDYVSQNLHHWIDLIFGFKQRGKEAAKADNLFYYMTYEGEVDLDAVTDDVAREAIEAQITNFGQTPTQLFQSPHPQRLRTCKKGSLDWQRLTFMHSKRLATSDKDGGDNGSGATSGPAPISTVPGGSSNVLGIIWDDPIVLVQPFGDKLLIVQQSAIMRIFKFTSSIMNPDDPLMNEAIFEISPDSPYVDRLEPIPLSKSHVFGSQSVVASSDQSTVISCGYCDNSVYLWSQKFDRVSLFGCEGVVQCLAWSDDGQVFATGSADTTVNIWKFKPSPDRSELMHTLCGHHDEVSSVAINPDLDVCVSGSRGGSVLVHTLRKGKLLRTLDIPTSGRIAILAVTASGYIIVCNDTTIHLFTVNGVLVATVNTTALLAAVKCSPDGRYLYAAEGRKLVVYDIYNRFEQSTNAHINDCPITLCVVFFLLLFSKLT
jgi:hypothetical protein